MEYLAFVVIDLLDSFLESTSDYEYIFKMTDEFSKFTSVHQLRMIVSEQVIDIFRFLDFRVSNIGARTV